MKQELNSMRRLDLMPDLGTGKELESQHEEERRNHQVRERKVWGVEEVSWKNNSLRCSRLIVAAAVLADAGVAVDAGNVSVNKAEAG